MSILSDTCKEQVMTFGWNAPLGWRFCPNGNEFDKPCATPSPGKPESPANCLDIQYKDAMPLAEIPTKTVIWSSQEYKYQQQWLTYTAARTESLKTSVLQFTSQQSSVEL